MAMLSGESMPRILMQVIRFCINSNDKQLKKLCMLYWEVVPKYQEPTPEQILAAAAGGPPVVRSLFCVCRFCLLLLLLSLLALAFVKHKSHFFVL